VRVSLDVRRHPTNNMEDDDIYSFDEAHPIPNLSVVDINTVKKGGGSDLIIIIATPLRAEERSLRRLLKKIEVYLAFIQSEQFQSESGPPTPENTTILVKIHRDSAPEAFELLYRNRDWVKNNNATLEIDPSLPESEN
jgi:Family of unknown function (DUF6572)